jgi:hypothetical protein
MFLIVILYSLRYSNLRHYYPVFCNYICEVSLHVFSVYTKIFFLYILFHSVNYANKHSTSLCKDYVILAICKGAQICPQILSIFIVSFRYSWYM